MGGRKLKRQKLMRTEIGKVSRKINETKNRIFKTKLVKLINL